MKTVLSAIWNYLKDWRNWLVHALVGIVLLVLVIWVPVQWWIKLIVIVLVVTFNSCRMIISKKKKERQEN